MSAGAVRVMVAAWRYFAAHPGCRPIRGEFSEGPPEAPTRCCLLTAAALGRGLAKVPEGGEEDGDPFGELAEFLGISERVAGGLIRAWDSCGSDEVPEGMAPASYRAAASLSRKLMGPPPVPAAPGDAVVIGGLADPCRGERGLTVFDLRRKVDDYMRAASLGDAGRCEAIRAEVGRAFDGVGTARVVWEQPLGKPYLLTFSRADPAADMRIDVVRCEDDGDISALNFGPFTPSDAGREGPATARESDAAAHAVHFEIHEIKSSRDDGPPPRRVELALDPDDFRDVMAELEFRRGRELPEGGSNDAGAHVAEIVRDLRDYRDMYDADHPRGVSGRPGGRDNAEGA